MKYWCLWNAKDVTLTKKDDDGKVISETVYLENEMTKFSTMADGQVLTYNTNVYEMEKFDTEAELETKVDSLKGAGYYKEATKDA